MTSIVYRPWLHRWALLTAVAVFPLLLSGGTVTSLKVGMADPEWPSPPWYMLVISWAEAAALQGRGFLIEHGHRQIGWIVGVLTVILAVWLGFAESRRWLRWLGVAALVGVGLQGLLGGLRVLLHARYGLELAMAHGIFGQLVFCLLACIALFTSRGWIEAGRAEVEDAGRLQRLCLLTTLLLAGQLAVGVWLRQQGQGSHASVLILHLFFAAAVLAHALMLVARVRRIHPVEASGRASRREPDVVVRVRRMTRLLAGLVAFQILLGVGAWWFGGGTIAFQASDITPARAILTTAHVGIGAVVLAVSTMLTVRAYHHLTTEPKVAAVPIGTAEGVA